MYTATTHNIRVSVQPVYLTGQSLPKEQHYVWAYTVRIENKGEQTVQLMNRHWHITDGRGAVQQVRGPGVVGVQPTLKPGEVYQYVSGAALHTSSGLMRGAYELHTEGGDRFLVDIPAFSLDSPDQLQRPN